MISPFSTVRPGGQLSAAELNRAFAELERQTRITFAPPLECVKDGGGFRVGLEFTKTFWAELTDLGDGGSGSGGASTYSWQEGRFDQAGEWVVLTAGRSGQADFWPAYEINGLEVPLETNGHPTRVRMWETDFAYVVFWSGGAETSSGSGSGGSNVWTIPVESCDPATGTITTTTYRITFPRGTVVERVV